MTGEMVIGAVHCARKLRTERGKNTTECQCSALVHWSSSVCVCLSLLSCLTENKSRAEKSMHDEHYVISGARAIAVIMAYYWAPQPAESRQSRAVSLGATGFAVVAVPRPCPHTVHNWLSSTTQLYHHCSSNSSLLLSYRPVSLIWPVLSTTDRSGVLCLRPLFPCKNSTNSSVKRKPPSHLCPQ